MKPFWHQIIAIIMSAMMAVVCPVWSNRVHQEERHPRIVDAQRDSPKHDDLSYWPIYYEENYDKAIEKILGNRYKDDQSERSSTASKQVRPSSSGHQARRTYPSADVSRQKSLRFNANKQTRVREDERPDRYLSKSNLPQTNIHTQQATESYEMDGLSSRSLEVETGRSITRNTRPNPTTFFHDREEKKKLSYKSRKGARDLDNIILPTINTSEVKEKPRGDVTTEPMTVFSTSNPDDRMPLIRGKDKYIPGLTFFADDQDAASRISMLTTLYDDQNYVANRHENGRSGVITSPSVGEELKFYTTTADDTSTYVANGIERETQLSAEKIYRAADWGHSDYFPSRYRPSDTRPGEHNTPKAGGGFSKAKHMKDMTRVTHIEAECQDDFMRIHVRFNGSFQGLVYSSEYSHDLECVYINGSGQNTYEFFIKLNRCGTLGTNDFGDKGRPMQKNVMWNTLTVQYNPLIEEEWDEHFKVTCEYGLEIWNTVTFPFLDVEVQTGNPMMFTLSPPECHMEIRYGFGPDGKRVSSPVRVGDPLTLVIYMRSKYDGFDIVVSDCFAHNGGAKKIMLIDSYGCPVDDKLISHFDGQSLRDGVFETQVFAFMKTFRFTGSPALYIECGVRMCHGDCPTQLCHWRRSRKGKSRRSVSDTVTTTTTAPPANVSDSLNLFQSLQVVRDDDNSRPGSLLVTGDEEFCFKSNHFTVLVGTAGALLGIFVVACLILCMRLRRFKKNPDNLQVPQLASQRTYRSDFIPPSKRRLE